MLTNPRDTFRGQSRSANMVPFDMLGTVYYSNFVPRDIRLQKCCDLAWNQGYGSLWADVNSYHPSIHLLRPTDCSTHQNKLRRPQFRRPRTACVEQSSCCTASTRHYTDNVQEQTEDILVQRVKLESAGIPLSWDGRRGWPNYCWSANNKYCYYYCSYSALAAF